MLNSKNFISKKAVKHQVLIKSKFSVSLESTLTGVCGNDTSLK